MAFNALNLMCGAIDWAGLPVIMEVLGVEDTERMIRLMGSVLQHERAD